MMSGNQSFYTRGLHRNVVSSAVVTQTLDFALFLGGGPSLLPPSNLFLTRNREAFTSPSFHDSTS